MSDLGFIKKGRAGLTSASGPFVKIDPDKHVEIVPLTSTDEAISFYQHSIWLEKGNSPMFVDLGGPDDPGRMLGSKSRQKTLLHVLLKNDDDEWEEKIYSHGIIAYRQLCDVEDAIGESIAGKVIRVNRSGAGIETRYNCVFTGKSLDLKKWMKANGKPTLELLDFIGPTTRKGIIAMLKEAGLWTFDDDGDDGDPDIPDTESEWEDEEYE